MFSVAPGKRQDGQWSSGRTARSVEVALKICCILLYIYMYRCIYIYTCAYNTYIYMYIHVYNYIYKWYLIIYEYIVVFISSAHDCFFLVFGYMMVYMSVYLYDLHGSIGAMDHWRTRCRSTCCGRCGQLRVAEANSQPGVGCQWITYLDMFSSLIYLY